MESYRRPHRTAWAPLDNSPLQADAMRCSSWISVLIGLLVLDRARVSGRLLHVMVNWVCFDCRWAGRRSGSVTDVACPKCGDPAVFLGTKIEVPPKSKASDWIALRDWYYSAAQAIERRIYAQQVRRRHDLERKIRDLTALPDNEGRASLVKRLRSELETLRHDV